MILIGLEAEKNEHRNSRSADWQAGDGVTVTQSANKNEQHFSHVMLFLRIKRSLA